MDAVSGRVVLPNLDGRAAKLLEDLRSVLKTGSVKYDMPVYDPATVEQVPLEIKVVGQTARLVVKDITVHGTSDYEIAEITQLSNTNNLDIKIARKPVLTAWAQVTAKSVLDKFLTGVAADSLLPREIHIATIDHEAHAILMQLVNLALKAGLAA
ncbi:hypothetical protein FOCC_FOCC014915 [Frankliniella occidentalis]|nr:hypothetical protein FOCC_FOCC014915 [Frankliniella occidentalis]